MVDAYSEIARLENHIKLHKQIDDSLLRDTFKEVMEEFPDPEVSAKVIRYIAFAYGRNSDKLVLHKDWQTNKRYIAIEVDLPDEYHTRVVDFESTIGSVYTCAHKFLILQGDSLWKHLQTLKDCYAQQCYAAVSNILDKDGKMNYDQKFKCMQHAEELRKLIASTEQEYLGQFDKLKPAVNDLNDQPKEKTLSIEDFAHNLQKKWAK
jgi:hypothetical protein